MQSNALSPPPENPIIKKAPNNILHVPKVTHLVDA
jgi:hypothetical protein